MAAQAVLATTVPVPFFGRVRTELKKLFTHVPGWEASASATLTYVAPMVEAVVTLADPGAAPLVDALIEKVQSAMAAAAVVIKAAGPAPTLVTYLNAINGDIAQITSVAGLKDPASITKMTALLDTITGEVNAILEEVGTIKST